MIRILALLMLFVAAAPAAAQAPFASERIGVAVRGSGPDVVLIPGLSSHPEVWDSTDRGAARLPLPSGPRRGLRRHGGRAPMPRGRCSSRSPARSPAT